MIIHGPSSCHPRETHARGQAGRSPVVQVPSELRSSEVQRRSLLCNAVLLFEDTGELLPDGRIVAPHRPPVAA
ncbi:DUF5999 family protein [Streptomyces sp. NPDC060366]|uniref:DUF5999 family protein n=1 Tax=Streptomyces sp. NPDC060366 TaxID=3347105 RepID=UPI003650ABE1